MAKVYSPLAGKVRGRVGSTVFRNGQRATVAAQYNPQVANPKTAAQAVQRAAFATATTAQSALIDIVDHSHEKLTSRRENLQRFVSQNTELVRAGILADYNGGETSIRPVLKGAKIIVPNAYVISEGSLLFPRTQWVSEGSAVGFPLSGTIPETISTDEQYAEALAAIGLLPGDQISLVGIIRDPSTVVATFEADGETFYNFACEVVRARITFKSSLPEAFSGSLFGNGVFNPELVAKREGQMLAETAVVSGANWLRIESPLADGTQYSMDAAVLIRSQETSSRVAYSNGRMIVTAEADYNVAWPMARSYMEGASVRIGAQPFLDNPVATFVSSDTNSAVVLTATYDDVQLPTFVDDDALLLKVETEEALASLRVSVKVGNTTFVSEDIVGKTSGETILQIDETRELRVAEPISSVTGGYAVRIGFVNASGILLGGSGFLAGGRAFTF